MISLMPLPALPALTHTVTMRADPIGTTMNVEEAENEKYKIKSVKLKTGHVMKYICQGQNGPYAWFSLPPSFHTGVAGACLKSCAPRWFLFSAHLACP